MDQTALAEQFPKLLPLAAEWAAAQEEVILRDGVALSDSEIEVARAAGIRRPERVRLLQVVSIPTPSHPILQAACTATNFVPQSPRGLTLRYGIFVRADCWQDRHLLAHEFVHVAQYEQLGGITPFLTKYLSECATVGYGSSPMEQEASTTGERICNLGEVNAAVAH